MEPTRIALTYGAGSLKTPFQQLFVGLRYFLYSAYGCSVVYPSEWRVELNPSSKREEGDVVFHSPVGDKLYVSWGPLEKAKKKFGDIRGHAEYSVGRLRGSRGVGGFEVLESKDSSVNGHRAVRTTIRLTVFSPGVFGLGGRPVPKRVYSAHLYCEDSSRYFVVYTLCGEETHERVLGVFESCVSSLRCHEKELELGPET